MKNNFEKSFNMADLQKSFLCCEQIPSNVYKDLLANISWDQQKVLLELTVLHPLILKYPIKKKYQRQFLQTVISVIEQQNIEVYDDLYNEFCKLKIHEDDDEKSYKHYIINKEKCKSAISIKESTSFVSEGTTGLCAWEASHALVDYFCQNSDIIKNKSTLELGAGVGLTGLFLWTICYPKKYYLSDCHPSTLKLLCENIKMNLNRDHSDCLSFSNFKAYVDNSIYEEETEFLKTFKSSNGQELNVLNLDWEFEEHCENLSDIDIILAADVVYDLTIIPSLCKCINTLLKQSSKNCTAFVACTVRNADTISSFISEIENLQLQVNKVVRFQSEESCTRYKTPVDIYKIWKN